MRQLTGLDAQFLALESDTTYGHVGGLAIFDPSTAPGGKLTLADIKRLHEERLHLLPPLRWKLVEVPLGPGPALLGRRPRLRPRLPRARDRAARARRRRAALDAGEPDLLPAAGPLAAAVGAVRHPGRARRQARRDDVEDPPRDGRRHVGRRDHGRALRPVARGARDPAPPQPTAEPATRPRPSRCWGAAMIGVPRQFGRATRSLGKALPHIDVMPSVLGIPGATTASRNLSRARNLVTRNRDGDVLERPRHRAPRVPVQPQDRPPPDVRVRLGRARAGQAHQERARRDRQRRRRRTVGGRDPRLADRARRAARAPGGRTDPGLGAHRGAARDLRQPRSR